MRRLLIGIIVVLLAFTSLPSLALGNEEAQLLYLRAGMTMTAQMVGSALDIAASGEPGNAIMRRITDISFLKPLKAVIITLDSRNVTALETTLDSFSNGFVPALGDMLNNVFSEDYAAMARELAASEDLTGLASWLDMETDEYVFVLLAYETDLSLTGISGRESANSVFIISDSTVPEQICDEYIEGYLAQLGVEGAKYEIYEQTELDELLDISDTSAYRDYDASWDYFDSDGYLNGELLADAVTGSEARFARMGAELIGSPYYNGEFSAPYLLARYMGSTWDGGDMSAVRFVAEHFGPRNGFGNSVDWSFTNRISESVLPADIPELGTEASEAEIPDDATLLFVLVEEHPITGTSCEYDMMLEASFPLERIPESVGDADYIVLARTTWDESYKVSGIDVYDGFTTISVYDAHTGALIKELGSFTSTPTGYIVVYNSYYYMRASQRTLLSTLNAWLFSR